MFFCDSFSALFPPPIVKDRFKFKSFEGESEGGDGWRMVAGRRGCFVRLRLQLSRVGEKVRRLSGS